MLKQKSAVNSGSQFTLKGLVSSYYFNRAVVFFYINTLQVRGERGSEPGVVVTDERGSAFSGRQAADLSPRQLCWPGKASLPRIGSSVSMELTSRGLPQTRSADRHTHGDGLPGVSGALSKDDLHLY